MILLLERGREGDWTAHIFGRKEDSQTRPVVLIDEENRKLYVAATTPCCGNARLPESRGGEIYYKRTSLEDISFEEGRGTPLIQNSADTDVNDATSTKQNLDGETGLLVLASDKSSKRYLHNAIDLG